MHDREHFGVRAGVGCLRRAGVAQPRLCIDMTKIRLLTSGPTNLRQPPGLNTQNPRSSPAARKVKHEERMKTALTVLLLTCCFTSSARADFTANAGASTVSDLRDGRNLEAGGAVTATLGGVVMVAGVIACIISPLIQMGHPEKQADRDSVLVGGGIAVALGAVGLATGIPIAVVGGQRKRGAQRRLFELGASATGLRGSF